MKVILLKDVGGVGRSGTVVEVADGYAMNFLIGRGMAEQATPKKLAHHEKHLAEAFATKKAGEEKLAKAIQAFEGARVEIKVRATEKGGLFKSIGSKEVVAALAEQKNVHIPEEAIQIEHPIKQVGEHSIHLSAFGAKAKMIFVVAAAS